MQSQRRTPDNHAPRHDVLAIHVMAALTTAARQEARLDLESLAKLLGVRKADVRSVVSQLDRQGFVDALRMRPTLLGFALGAGASAAPLASLRPERKPARAQLRVAA